MIRDLRLLYGYRMASRLYFHLPILLVFFLRAPFSILAAEILLAVYGVAVTAGAAILPSLLGRMSRKWLIACGEVLKCSGLGLVVSVHAVWGAAIGQAINGLGFAIAQGTDGGLLATVAGSDQANTRAQINTQSYMFLSLLASGLLGAILFSREPNAVFYASMGAALLSAVIVVGVREPSAPVASHAAGASSATISGAPATREEMWWVRYYVILRAVMLAIFVGALPLLFFKILHLNVAWLGAVLGIFSLAGFICARYFVTLTRRVGTRRLAVATPLLAAAAMAAFAATPPLPVALLAMFTFGLSAGAVRPLTVSGLGQRRNELLATMERGFGVLNAMILVALGALLEASSFQVAMITLTLAAVTAGAIFLTGPAALITRTETQRIAQ
jgi:hypothetical protein